MYKAYTFHDLFPAFNKEQNVAFFFVVSALKKFAKKTGWFCSAYTQFKPTHTHGQYVRCNTEMRCELFLL